jgi:hypothetical protein
MSIHINAYATLCAPPDITFPHTLTARRDRTDPELLSHLRDFAGYVVSRREGRMDQRWYDVVQHIYRVQHQVSMLIEEDALDDFAEWAWAANAVTYLPDNTIRDPDGLVLIDLNGDAPDEDATLPYPAAARERQARIHEQLIAQGIRVFPGLLPVVGEPEVRLRDASDVARRMLALFVAAVRAESLAANDPLSSLDLLRGWATGYAALSPDERAFVKSDRPEPSDIVQFAWRYEAAHVLQWALGLTDDLAFPSTICDVPVVAEIAAECNSRKFVERATLRPTAEILDALDLHFRLQWAIRQDRLDNIQPPENLEVGVIQERRYTLNWLVRFMDLEWDEIDTPT